VLLLPPLGAAAAAAVAVAVAVAAAAPLPAGVRSKLGEWHLPGLLCSPELPPELQEAEQATAWKPSE
jgi:hypothetical protein